MQEEIKFKAYILLIVIGAVIFVQLIEFQKSNLEYQKPDDEPVKVSSIQTTTFTTSSQVGTATTTSTTL